MLKILIINIFLAFHPIHVTLTSIDQAQGNDTLKVFFRMYYDDFLRDYKLFIQESNLKEINEPKDIKDEKLNKYFNDRVRIQIDRKLLEGKLISFSNDGYEILMSLLYKSDINPKKFKIRNTVLTKIYSDQANMVYLNINTYQDAIKLTPKINWGVRKFKN